MAATVNVLDPELPLLASRAAVELDGVIQKHNTSLVSVHRLAERLRHALPSCEPNEPPRALLADAATVTILGQAVNIADQNNPPRNPLSTIDELQRRTKQIVEELGNAASADSQMSFEWARAFCLALSKCAASYRKSVYDLRPPHPLRR